MALTLRAPGLGVDARARGVLTIACLVAIVAVAAPAVAQRPYDPNHLRDLSSSFQRALDARRTPAYFDLIGDPAQQARDRAAGVQLMFMRDNGTPTYFILNNLVAAKTVRTWDVWPLGVGGGFYSLTGSTTNAGELAVWDGGGVLTIHQEFGGRVSQMDVPVTPTHPHSTHVAGTMVAGGVDPTARGMSYEAPLHAYDWFSDTVEMANAAANYPLMISNHSYGIATGWEANYWYGDLSISTTEDYVFGFYDSNAADFDAIAYNAPNYLICVAAGNDRNDVAPGGSHFHWNGVAWVSATDVHGNDGQFGGYDTVGAYAVAKNVLTVGAVNDIPAGYSVPADVVQSTFSSWGPCDDGRIKPDIVANGVSLRSAVDTNPTAYANMSGTSMASPNAAGSVNLIAHEYQRRFGAPPLSSTLKAIVINTADEAGPSPGPDYSNGWGLLNTRRAIDLIALHGNQAGGTYEATIQTGEVHEYYFTVDSPQDVRLTLAWTDPPGPVQFPSLDPSTPMLQHDLDVRVTHVVSGITYMPWVLDLTSPSSAATTGDNTIDNVEQVDIAGAPAGDYYVTVTVKSPFLLTQSYGMVWRGMRAVQPFDYTSGGSAHIDLGAPDLAPTRHEEKGFQERGAFITAIRDVAVSEVGLNVAIPFATAMTVTIYEANGFARGPAVGGVTATIRHPGEIVHYVPVSVFLRACQDYEIAVRFYNTVSWPAWDEPPGGAVPSVEEPFDVGAAVRVRDGSFIGLPADPILPHIVLKGAVLPLQFADLGPPGPWAPAAIPGGTIGVYVTAQKTFTLDNLGFAAAFPPFTTLPLYARVYRASGTTRGTLLAEGYLLTNSGPLPTPQFLGVPIEAVLEEGADYDFEVEFPSVGGLDAMNETGITPYTIPPLRVRDAEAFGNPAADALGHFRIGWTDLAGGETVDLRKHTDVYPPPFLAPVGALVRGAYVTSLATQRVHSLGVRADVAPGQTITMRIYEAAGTTRGPLLTEGQIVSTSAGLSWHDVPVATELVAGNGYDIEVAVANANGWRYWSDAAGMPFTRFGVIQVLDAEQGGSPLATELVELRLNPCTSTITAVPDPTPAPMFSLAAPYPNPVTGRATIDFSLDRDESVSIAVFDVAGRRVATLLENAPRAAGPGSVEIDAGRIASGVYFVKMQTPTQSVSRKVTIVR